MATKSCSGKGRGRKPEKFPRSCASGPDPRFNAVVYALDTLLPVVSLQMDDYWSPDHAQRWGYGAQVFQWFQIVIGWPLTFLTVSGFSGLVKLK